MIILVKANTIKNRKNQPKIKLRERFFQNLLTEKSTENIFKFSEKIMSTKLIYFWYKTLEITINIIEVWQYEVLKELIRKKKLSWKLLQITLWIYVFLSFEIAKKGMIELDYFIITIQSNFYQLLFISCSVLLNIIYLNYLKIENLFDKSNILNKAWLTGMTSLLKIWLGIYWFQISHILWFL